MIGRVILVAGLLVLIFGLAILPAFAQAGHHGDGHSEHHEWYEKLRQPGTGYGCCHGDRPGPNGTVIEGDCRPTRAYLGDDGVWRAMVDGRWAMVPPSRVIDQLAPDGRSHVCASKTGLIFCFIGGSPKS